MFFVFSGVPYESSGGGVMSLVIVVKWCEFGIENEEVGCFESSSFAI